jgi:threonine synthase
MKNSATSADTSGREPKIDNDLFFVCSLIEFIARKTKNTRKDVVAALGNTTILHYLELADVYHCESMETLTAELVQKHSIPTGNFDNISACRYSIPSHFDIGKVYKRLILAIASHKNLPLTNALLEVYNSWISPKIDDYNSSMYYENPEYLFESYLAGESLKE